MEETMEILKKETDAANEQRCSEHKEKLDTDSRMKEIADENKKLRQNYDVLKEHEMSIIRDCENRKQAEIKAQQDLLLKEKEVNAEYCDKIESLRQQIQDLQSQCRLKDNDYKILDTEKKNYYDKNDSQTADIVVLKEEISTFK